ncbi:MAG: trehalose-6-phosphate synthase [Planctomycetes bacterium]|nr:trehalose-6-phosphate synthase [Planctomycetota bacterium]
MLRLSLRFILPLLVVLALLATAVVPLVDVLLSRWSLRDLDLRSSWIAGQVQDREEATGFLTSRSRSAILDYFNRTIQDERLYAIGFFGNERASSHRTTTFPRELLDAHDRLANDQPEQVLESSGGALHVSVHPVRHGDEELGKLVLVHDMSFITRRGDETKKYVFYFFLILGAVISLLTVATAQLSLRGWLAGMRALLRGEMLLRPPASAVSPELKPLVKDLRALVRELDTERRARDESQVTWSPQALRRILHDDLSGDEVLTVSNRQPYIHRYHDGQIDVQVPASGLVTALEPVMRACSGTWIAHGNGSGDRAVVDEKDGVAVPPEDPCYRVRRVWLTDAEESGYYYGFANEGLWPLCHIAHTRPIFRTSDWNHYETVNRRFADAVRDEAHTADPVVLVQDYHFGLLPRLIFERIPAATIITFWHIPWPNPEAFGICPWREELLEGLLGSSILGFHTRFHCNNFIDTVDRYLEARIDRETSVISFKGKQTAVNHYPISIEWPVRWLRTQESVETARTAIRARNGMHDDLCVGVGVDRLDYTKGIIERFLAIERLLELEPSWVGKFAFVQIAAPSRTKIDQYQRFEVEVRALAERINERFGVDGYVPIRLLVEHHEPEQVFEYYRGCDVCIVSSLHDGMNLVAKEFVAAREDERGVLILSQFTGAARELPEALMVNPYNVDQFAAALHVALTMSPREQRDRMRSMRGLIQEFNVYRWAGKMLIDAARMRQRRRVLGENGDGNGRLRGLVIS